MPRDRYPDEVELKVKSDEISTDDRRHAADELLDAWPINLVELEEESPHSRKFFATVRDEYFGPIGDDRTFKEIKQIFGTVGDYLDWREAKEAEAQRHPEQMDVSPDYLRGFREGVKFGHELAENDDE